MRSDVSLAVCGDLPQRRGGSVRPAMRGFSYLRSVRLATGGEKYHHLSRVWPALPDQWRIVER
jgi:hypothetical protein